MLIKHLRELIGSLSRLRQEFLLFTKLAVFLRSDKRVGDLSERVLNGLPVGEHGFLPLRAGEPEARTECSALEDWLTNAQGSVPGLRWLTDKPVQGVALKPAQPSEGQA